MGSTHTWQRLGLAAFVLAVLAVGCRSPSPGVWRACAHITAPAIGECSGIVRSRQYAGVFWIHNDSGDAARLFAVDLEGTLLREVRVQGAHNVDWEDLAIDDAGHLFIGDFGNNDNERQDLVIYVIEEPDPAASPADPVLEVPVLRRVPFHYPEQRAFPDSGERNYDCEAMFWHDGGLYILTKHRSDTRTVLYRVPLQSSGRRAVVRLGEFAVGSQVTAADISPDGRILVVLSYQYILVFERPADGENYLAGRSHRVLIEGRQCEGICFDGDRIVFVNEQREVFCLDLETLRRRDRFLPEPPRTALPRVEPRLDGKPSEWGAEGSLELHPELSIAAAEESRAASPEVRVGWSPQGLLLHATWRLDGHRVRTSEEAIPLLYLMLGPPRPRSPGLSKRHRVWVAELTPEHVEFRPHLPQPGPALEDVVVRWLEHELVLEVLVPVQPPGRLRAGRDLGFNLLIFQPTGAARTDEWAWAGSSSTQPLENPLLWGRVRLQSAR
ncbi:MAG: hypothetical protein ACE5G2_12255 [Candidatus Krumholzibacteriia bacterium]